MPVRFQVKTLFFDTDKVLKALGKARVKVLSKAGAFIRRDAKGLIRPSKNPSKPGRPPHSHNGILKDRLFFSYNPASGSVVVGPEKTNQIYFDGNGKPSNGTVPKVLEHGGVIQVVEVLKPGYTTWRRLDHRRRQEAGSKIRMRKVTIAARPYMQPALDMNNDKFPGLWAGVITD